MAKKFKPHMMYKGNKSVMAKTMGDHLRLKKQGYGHTAPKYAEGGMTPNDPPKGSSDSSRPEVGKWYMKQSKEVKAMFDNAYESAHRKGASPAQSRESAIRAIEKKQGSVIKFEDGGKMPNVKPDNREDLIVTYKKGGKAKSTVNSAGNYTKPTMRKRLFNRIKAGTKGGGAGQWSARKAQLLARLYKKNGGGYR